MGKTMLPMTDEVTIEIQNKSKWDNDVIIPAVIDYINNGCINDNDYLLESYGIDIVVRAETDMVFGTYTTITIQDKRKIDE